MRRLGKLRPILSTNAQKRLANEALKIAAHNDSKAEAARRFANARGSKWFREITRSLADLSGAGQRCMFCSGSEASDVEHFFPKAVFPDQAMAWENFLWSCTICNRHKGNRFPPHTEPGGQIINPVDEDVWDFFFIDEFGLLTPRFDVTANSQSPRAVSTRDILSLNREAIQESRTARLKDLQIRVSESIDLYKNAKITKEHLVAKIAEWREQPFQPDVADYFLAGPGKSEEPFCSLFAVVDGT